MLSIAQSGTNTTRFGWALPPDERCQGTDNSLICSYKQANPKDMEPEARDWVTGLVDCMIDEATSRSRAASGQTSATS